MGQNAEERQAEVKTRSKSKKMSSPEKHRLAVLCDFDGTITPTDVLEVLYRSFAGPGCSDFMRQWLEGEISTPQEIMGCLATTKATQVEMEAVLDTVQLDPGFPELFSFCQRRGYPFIVLSDGLRWYIDYLLTRHGFCNLTIYANEIHFMPEGVRVSSPWYQPDTPRRGTSKPAIIRKYQEDGYHVVFIGDGLTDVEAVEVADVVYARDRLLEYCRKLEIPAIGFSDMRDLMAHWKA
jgi:2-hydroxy-3-keto-5-methylthiopentenyl-1-phosphate phosphatase